MKIAYLLGPTCLFSTAGHGVKMQAKVWGEELVRRGHEVSYINEWESIPVTDFDIVHLFGAGLWLLDVVKRLSRKNPNIFLSPIIDSKNNTALYRLATHVAIPRLNIYSQPYALRGVKPFLKRIYVRSDHEGRYISQSYGIDKSKIVKIPLSGRFQAETKEIVKEPFCLSVSSICNGRKNIVRLIQAANKYGFKLVLAGNPGTAKEFEPLKRAIGGNRNIEVLGFVDTDT
ncbi:MAG: hypothetical protein NC453_20075 [Muribaculum sp.]|nr:hypothetical protein [Muribaculum sp.]